MFLEDEQIEKSIVVIVFFSCCVPEYTNKPTLALRFSPSNKNEMHFGPMNTKAH